MKKIDRWNLERCGYKRSDDNHNQFNKFENGFYFTVIRDKNAYGDPCKPQVVNWRMLVDYKSNEFDYPCRISVCSMEDIKSVEGIYTRISTRINKRLDVHLSNVTKYINKYLSCSDNDKVIINALNEYINRAVRKKDEPFIKVKRYFVANVVLPSMVYTFYRFEKPYLFVVDENDRQIKPLKIRSFKKYCRHFLKDTVFKKIK